jgi:hypothetical protein
MVTNSSTTTSLPQSPNLINQQPGTPTSQQQQQQAQFNEIYRYQQQQVNVNNSPIMQQQHQISPHQIHQQQQQQQSHQMGGYPPAPPTPNMINPGMIAYNNHGPANLRMPNPSMVVAGPKMMPPMMNGNMNDYAMTNNINSNRFIKNKKLFLPLAL